MRIGVYKPGQGFWVRTMTAIFGGIIVLIGGVWLGTSLGAVDLPKATWSMTVTPTGGASEPALSVTPGQQVTLLGDPLQPGAPAPEIGKAEVVVVNPSVTGTGQQVVVKKLTLKAGADATQIKAIGGAGLVATVVGVPLGKPIFEPLYLQAAGVSLLVLIGGIAVYWLVGSRASTVEFLIATDGEMKKVNWSTRKDIIGSTQVVILWSVLLVVGLFLVDLAFSTFFQMIGVLQTK